MPAVSGGRVEDALESIACEDRRSKQLGWSIRLSPPAAEDFGTRTDSEMTPGRGLRQIQDVSDIDVDAEDHARERTQQALSHLLRAQWRRRVIEKNTVQFPMGRVRIECDMQQLGPTGGDVASAD